MQGFVRLQLHRWARAAPALRRFPGLLLFIFNFFYFLRLLLTRDHGGIEKTRGIRRIQPAALLLLLFFFFSSFLDSERRPHRRGFSSPGRCVAELNIHKNRGIPFRLGEPRGPLPLFSRGGERVPRRLSDSFFFFFFFFSSFTIWIAPCSQSEWGCGDAQKKKKKKKRKKKKRE